MRVSETITRKGFFWKAGHEDKKVSGTLKIEDSGVSELEIIGSLTDENPIAFGAEIESNFLIYGQIDNDNYATLYNCYYKKRTHSLTSGISTSIIKARTSLLGIASDEENPQITYKAIYFELEDLSPWIDVSGFKIILPHDQKRFLVDFSLPSQVEANLTGIGKFKIEFNANYPVGFKTEINLKQTTALKIYPESPIKIEESIEIISKIQHFVMLATQSSLTLKNVKAILSSEEENTEDKSLPVIVQWYYQSLPFHEQSSSKNKKDALFTISDITKNIDTRLNKWLEIYKKSQPSIRLYFSAITGAHKYGENTYLSLSQAAESYHRTISENKKLTFKQRIEELTKPFQHLYKFDTDLFLEKTTHTRNYLTHYNEDIKSKAATGVELYFLNKKLQDLMTLNLLKDIGFTDDEIEKISKKAGLLRDDTSD